MPTRIVQFQDEQIEALIDLLKFGAPSAGPLHQALLALESSLGSTFVRLSPTYKWGAINVPGFKIQVIKKFRQILGCELRVALDLANSLEGRWTQLNPELIEFLRSTYPEYFEFANLP